MSYGLHDFLGNVGVFLILLTFFLLQLEKMQATSINYLSINALGAVLILASLSQEFNFSAALIECAWLLVSAFGIARTLRKRRTRLE